MSIDELNEVLSNTTNQEIDIRNLDSLKLYLEAYYQVRFNGIDVYLYLKELNGEEIDKSDSRHDLYDENEELLL